MRLRTVLTAAAVAGLTATGTASAAEPKANPNAACVGYGITTYAPFGLADDVQRLIRTFGPVPGSVTSYYAHLDPSHPLCQAGLNPD